MTPNPDPDHWIIPSGIGRRPHVRLPSFPRNAFLGGYAQRISGEHRDGIPIVCTQHIAPSTYVSVGLSGAIQGRAIGSSYGSRSLGHVERMAREA